jgi:hypothetical protein
VLLKLRHHMVGDGVALALGQGLPQPAHDLAGADQCESEVVAEYVAAGHAGGLEHNGNGCQEVQSAACLTGESIESNVTNKMEENGRETPRQRFVRLANKRVVKAIKAIQLLGNLSSPAYQYDENDVTKIFEAIQTEVGQARSKFSNREKRGIVFSLE